MKKITQKKMKRIFAYLVTVVMIFTSFMQTTIPALAAECSGEHTFVYTDVDPNNNYTGTRTCSVCGTSESYHGASTEAPKFSLEDYTNKSKYKDTYINSGTYNIDNNSCLYIWMNCAEPGTKNGEFITDIEVNVSNPEVASFEFIDAAICKGKMVFKKTGLCSFTFRDKHDPSKKFKTYEMRVISNAVPKFSMSDCTVSFDQESYSYTGSAITPAPIVNYQGAIVPKNDYSCAYTNNTSVGTATVTISSPKTYWKGTKTANFEITGNQYNLSQCKMTLSQDVYTFNGKEKKPEVTITDPSGAVVASTLYSVTYTDNIYAGTATVTVTGTDAFPGTRSENFTINKLDLSKCSLLFGAQNTDTYVGYELNGLTYVVHPDGTKMSAITYFNVAYQNNVNAGEATATVTAMNTYSDSIVGSKTGTWTINPLNISGLTANVSSLTYNGTQQLPTISFSRGGRTLVLKDSDYTKTIGADVDLTVPGTKTMTIVGTGNFTGTKNIEFTINKLDVSTCDIGLTPTQFVYDGNAKEPAVTVYSNGVVIPEDQYDVAYTNNTAIGTATATVTGKTYCTGTNSKNFTIGESLVEAVDIATCNASAASVTYNGSEQKAAVTVKTSDNSTVLKENVDYTLSYSGDLVNVSQVTVTITGKGNYKGTKTLTYTMDRPMMYETTVDLEKRDYVYDGNAKEPAVTVRFNGAVVSADQYSVAYANNKEIGTATATITATATGNFTGSKEEVFTISRQDATKIYMEDCEITLSGNTFVFNGSAQTPEVTVKYKDNTLVKNTDYTLSYTDNVNVGVGSVKVVALGDAYAGEKTETFTITALDLAGCTATATSESFTYTGYDIRPAVTVKMGERIVPSNNYTVTYTNNREIGQATATITPSNDNLTGTQTATFAITAVNLSDCELEIVGDTEFEADGTPKLPTVKVTYNGEEVASTEYTVVCTNNTQPGTATVTVTAKNGGHFTGSKSINYTIVQTDIGSDACTATLSKTTDTYRGSEIKPVVTVKNGTKTLVENTDYTVTYNGDTTNVGTVDVVITGMGAYKGSKTLSYTITKAQMKNDNADFEITLSKDSYVADGTEKKPTVTLKFCDEIVHTSAYTVSYENNIEPGTATVYVTANDSSNFSGKISKTFTIEEPPVVEPEKIALGDCTISVQGSGYTYNTKEQKAPVTVSYNQKALTEDVDYTLTYANHVNAGTASVTIEGIGDYSGEQTREYTIAPMTLTSSNCSIPLTSYDYTGAAITPVVSVVCGTTVLASSNYTVTYKDNIEVGTASVTIAGKGNCTGSVTKTFEIKAVVADTVNLNSCTVTLSEGSFEYNGKSQKPDVVIKHGSALLQEGTDYTLSYSADTTNKGTVTITIQGINGYTGTLTKTYVIQAIKLSDCKIELDQTTYPADGTAKKPNVTVTYGDSVVASDQYSVSYSNNTAVGTAVVTVTGLGNYVGSKQVTFDILATSMEDTTMVTVSLDGYSFPYTGANIEPQVTVRMGEQVVAAANYNVVYTNNVNVTDTAAVTITGIGNFTGSRTINFAITAADFKEANVQLTGTVHIATGDAITPVVNVKYGDNALVKDIDYTVEYSNNIEVGTAKVTVTGIGNYTGSQELSFEIKQEVTIVDEQVHQQFLNHEGTYVYNNDATCTKDGTETAECQCGCGLTDTRTAANTKLEHTFNAYVSNGDATCMKDGTKTAYCIYGCGQTDVITDEKTKKSHLFQNYVSNNDATCTADGTETASCEYGCGTTHERTVVGSKVSHLYTNYVNSGEATCQKVGAFTATCDFGCGKTDTQYRKVDHVYGEYVSDNNATCTQNGTKTRSCIYHCGQTDTVTEENTKIAHRFVNYVSDNNATCMADGTETAACEYHCGIKDTRTLAGSKLAHKWGEYISNDDATCTNPGTKTAMCVYGCNTKNTVENTGAMGDHNYVDKTTPASMSANGSVESVCSVCGTVNSRQDIYAAKTVKLSKKEYNYTGKAIRPGVIVKDSKGKTIPSSQYTLSYSNNKKVGKATVTVTFRNQYQGSKKLSFTINPKKTNLSKVSKDKKAKNAIKVTWKKQGSVTGYQIRYAKKSSMSGAKTITVKGAKNTSTTIKNLKAKTKYYVQVRTYSVVKNKKYYSAWSAKKNITLK